MDTTSPFDPGLFAPGLDAFLAWADERGMPLSPRAAHAVFTLLFLHGARWRTGFPEPTSELAVGLLHEWLPQQVTAPAEELDAYPAVLSALALRTREARLLNAKRMGRLQETVAAAVPEFRSRMMNPSRPTWFLVYTMVMRAEAVRVDDAEAVRAWIAGFRRLPRGERVGRVLDVIGAQSQPDDDVRTRLLLMVIAQCGELARATLRAAVLEVGNRELGAALRDPADAVAVRRRKELSTALGDVDGVCAAFYDRWAAAGLAGELDDAPDLAPLPPDMGWHHLSEALANRHRLIWGDESGRPLTPVRSVPDLAEVPGLLRSAPLPAAAAELARWVGERGGAEYRRRVDDPRALPVPLPSDLAAAGELLGLDDPLTLREVWEFAVDGGFLRLTGAGTEESPLQAVPGEALEIWDQGSGQEAAELALNAAGAYLPLLEEPLADRVFDIGSTSDDETVLALADDIPTILSELYERDAPASVARLAALLAMWALPTAGEDEEPAAASDGDTSLRYLLRVTAPGEGTALDYRLPPDSELTRLLGLEDFDDADRAELAGLGHWITLLLDRLAAVGLISRAGEWVTLTPLGVLVVRDAFRLGGVQAPVLAEVTGFDANVLVQAAIGWRDALPAVTAWLAHREWSATAWRELLAAIAALHETADANSVRELFVLLDVDTTQGSPRDGSAPRPHRFPTPLPHGEDDLRAALTEAAADPAIGAFAAEALRRRGTDAPAAALSARAVLLVDRLATAALKPRLTDDSEDAALACAAVDQAASEWPGQHASLLPALAEADPSQAEHVFQTLAHHHSDPAVAEQARLLLKKSERKPVRRQRHRR